MVKVLSYDLNLGVLTGVLNKIQAKEINEYLHGKIGYYPHDAKGGDLVEIKFGEPTEYKKMLSKWEIPRDFQEVARDRMEILKEHINEECRRALFGEIKKETSMQYELSTEQQKRLDKWHYHRPNIGQPERFQKINDATRELARMIMELTPPGRQQALALTHLEDVRMRANSAIVLDEEA